MSVAREAPIVESYWQRTRYIQVPVVCFIGNSDTPGMARYVNQTIEPRWSRSILETWIESDLYGRQGKAVNNFKNTSPLPQSDLAHQTLKDPYCFDFLTLRKKHDEKELEEGLIEHIKNSYLSLGQDSHSLEASIHLE